MFQHIFSMFQSINNSLCAQNLFINIGNVLPIKLPIVVSFFDSANIRTFFDFTKYFANFFLIFFIASLSNFLSHFDDANIELIF